jgi:hypothetical protein
MHSKLRMAFGRRLLSIHQQLLNWKDQGARGGKDGSK